MRRYLAKVMDKARLPKGRCTLINIFLLSWARLRNRRWRDGGRNWHNATMHSQSLTFSTTLIALTTCYRMLLTSIGTLQRTAGMRGYSRRLLPCLNRSFSLHHALYLPQL